MYSEIHQLKVIGLNKAQVARKLAIDVKTVTWYWEVLLCLFRRIRPVNPVTSGHLIRSDPATSCSIFSLSKIRSVYQLFLLAKI